jgi:hypothetical protein
MKLAEVTKFHRKSGVAEGSAVLLFPPSTYLGNGFSTERGVVERSAALLNQLLQATSWTGARKRAMVGGDALPILGFLLDLFPPDRVNE